MHLITLLPLLLCGLLAAVPSHACGAHDGKTAVARVDGQAITRAELEDFAAAELRRLDTERHRLLEAALGHLVETRLLELEAARRGLDVETLVAAEVTSKVEITDAEVDAFYEQNRARIQRPKDAVADDLRAYLAGQRSQPLRQALVDGLRRRYGAETLLEPLRFDVVAAAAPAKGSDDAPVVVTVFTDFQCPACRRVAPELEQVHEAYGDKVRLELRHFPLRSIHPQAQQAAEAALCAADQGRFWPMHDALFADQGRLAVPDLAARAADLGLDADRFAACLEKGTHRDAVERDVEAGRAAGVASTPSLFVNGRPVSFGRGVTPFDAVSALVDDELRRRDG